MQTTHHILMIRPVNFVFNAQTAVNNSFQVSSGERDVQQKALQEFDDMVSKLRSRKIDVMVIDDTAEPHTPDSIFPNNWISFHNDGSVVLYPMFAENRRLERKPGVMEKIHTKFLVRGVIDLTGYEKHNQFLEGTGSLVLDRDNHIAYACISPRTDENLLKEFCRTMNYAPLMFKSVDEKGSPIYHTNVMMCVADKYVVICLESIPDEEERSFVVSTIRDSGKEIIPITMEQMNHFAGNMLQVSNADGEKFLVMSTQAYESLNNEQAEKLAGFNQIIHSPLYSIETNGGGSARCMMAEVHLSEL